MIKVGRKRKFVKLTLDRGHFITGEGEEYEQLDRYIKKNNLGDTIHLLGYQKNPYPLIHKADFFICSSRHESFSLVVAESIVLGTPVVTTDCTGPKELLGYGEYGLIVSNDVEGIEKGIKKMITDEPYRKRMREKIIERGSFFDTNRLIKEWEKELN